MATNNFINECKNRANGNRLGKITVDGFDNPITNSDKLQSFSIDSGCYVDGNIIGSVYAKCLKANFVSDIANLSGKNIDVQIGVKYASTDTEYINMGKYTVERPNNEITANMSQIMAYDNLYAKLDDKYVCNINYETIDEEGNRIEIYLSDLYADVCNQLGLAPKTTNILNGNIPIADNPFTNGEKNRTVLQTIAKISCSFVDIDNGTDEIDLCWLSQNEEPDYIFQKSDYANVEGGQVVCGPINCLIIKNSAVDDENVTIKDDISITQNGEHSIIISEDYILHNAELREQAIMAIWNRVKGMKYVDCKLTTYYGKPFLKLGNSIRVCTSGTEYFDTYVLKHKFDYDGAFSSVIESPVLTEQEIKTKQDVKLQEALRNTQIDLNKQKQIITQTVSSTSEALNQLNQITQTLNETTNLISQTGGSNLLRNTQFYQNADEWVQEEITDFEVITGNIDVEQNTINKSELILKNGTLLQDFSMTVGKDYTIAFKYKKEAINNRISRIRIYRTDNTYIEMFNSSEAQSTRKEFSYTFNASVNNARLEIYTDQDNFSINDLIIQSGTSTEWSPNATETRGLGHKLSGNALELYDLSNSGEKAILDYNNLVFEQNNSFKAEYGSNNMQVNSATVNQMMNICGLTYTKIDDDNVIVN